MISPYGEEGWYDPEIWCRRNYPPLPQAWYSLYTLNIEMQVREVEKNSGSFRDSVVVESPQGEEEKRRMTRSSSTS